MKHTTFGEAIQVLRNRMNGRWEGLEADGRDEMEQVLHDELGYTKAQSREMIDELIEAGQIRYRHARPGAEDAGVPPLPVVPVTGLGVGAGGTAPVAAMAISPGYWQIGSDSDAGDDDNWGRPAGQVDPTR